MMRRSMLDSLTLIRPGFIRPALMALAVGWLTALPVVAQDAAKPQDEAAEQPAEDVQPEDVQPAEEGGAALTDPAQAQPAEPDPKPTPPRRKPSRVRGGTAQPNDETGAKPTRPATRRPSRRTPARPKPTAEPPVTAPDPAATPENPAIDPATGEPLENVPAGPTEEIESEVDEDFEQMLKPAEERMYSFSIQEGTYGDLVRAFSRMSGLGVMGSAPEDTLTYVSTEQMDYKTAMSRVRELLFRHPENFYIWRTGNSLELIRMTEALRRMPLDRIYTSVTAFQEANLDSMELVMVVYTPEGDPGALDRLRDFMPDYVRIAPYSDKNAITIFALVEDVNKYMELVGIFRDVKGDPRDLKIIEVKHITPTFAVEMLPQLMPSFQQRGAAVPQPAAPARPGRKPQPAAEPVQTLSGMQGQGIDLVPYDAVSKLFVRAMPDKIAEVEEYLGYIDVEQTEKGDPVIIPLKHVRVEQMITLIGPLMGGGPAPAAAPATPATRRKRAPRGPAQQTGNVVVTDSVGLYANPANNTLIVVGDEEQVAEVRKYVELYDIPSERDTVRIALKNAEAANVAQQVSDILTNRQEPGVPVTVLVTPDSVGNALILTGTPQQLELAKSIVEALDVEDPRGPATVHTYRCKYAAPSFLVGLLNNFETQGAAAPVVQPATPAGQPQRKPVRRPPSRSTAAGKFQGDDASRMLIVFCNQDEWDNDYKPMIELLDSEQAPPLEKVTVIPVEKGDPQEIIEIVNQQINGAADGVQGGIGGVLLVPRPDAIVAIGGTDEEIKRIEALVSHLSYDPDAHTERRTFTLKHAEPATVKGVLEALLLKTSAPVPRAARPNRPRPGQNPAAVAAVSGAQGDIQIVESGRRDLIVVAPAKRMPEIEKLIGELDVDPVDAEVRVYDFPPGSNVTEISGSLQALYPGSGVIAPAAPGRPGQVKGAGADGDVRFIAQPASRKILVSAPKDLFPDIEEKIKLFGSDAPLPESQVIFYEVADIEATAAAEALQPILEAKHIELVAAGELPETPAAQPGVRPGSPGKAAVTVTAHPQGGRVLVVGPKLLQDLVPDLLKELDLGNDPRVMRTVQLERADPGEMVTAINAMLSGRSGAAAPARQPGAGRPRGGRGGRGAAQTRPVGMVASAQSQDVTVVAAPGGSAVVITGLADAVDEVETWVKELDASSTDARQIKIYAPKIVAADKFADAVMALVDSGGAAAAPKAAAADADEWDFDLTETDTRQGKDIDLVVDSWGGSLVASASPSKIREIDHLFEMYEGKDGKPPEIIDEPASPYSMYTLQHREDTYDAVYELEGIIDTIWTGSDKPKVDYIPWTKIIVIKGKPDTFEEVENLITEYVDKATETGTALAGPQFKTKYVKGMPAVDLLWLLKAKMGDKLELGGVPQPGHANADYGVEQIGPAVNPCVLPQSAFQTLAVITSAQAEPAEGKEAGPESQPSSFDRTEQDTKEEIRRSMMADHGRVPLASKTESDTPTAPVAPEATPSSGPAEAEGPEQIMEATVDLERNVLIFKGPRDGLKEIDNWIEDIMKELEGSPQPPDIRVFRLKHVDVTSAATVLENMFNAAPRQGGAMNPRQLQQQQRQLQQMLQAQQQAAQKGGQVQLPIPGAEDERGGRGTGRAGRRGGGREGEEEGEEPQAVAEAAQQEEGQIRVFPDPRTRTLIIRAATEQYPSIIKLLATIDKTGTGSEFRIYPLEKLNAADVEVTLKGMLGLDGSSTAAPRRQQNQRMTQMQNQMNAMGIPLMLELPGMEGESATLDASSQVKISSSPNTNSILAMAPEKTLDLIGKLIEQLEDQDAALFVTRFYPLQHGDAEEVVTALEAIFGKSGTQRGGGGGGDGAGRTASGYDPQDVNNPVFVAETRANRVMVRALQLDLDKIEPLIKELDVDSGGPREVVTYAVESGDAVAMAATLQKVYEPKPVAGGRQTSAAKMVRITGDQSSNTIFVDAPPILKDEILARLKEMDSKAADIQTITLKFGKPTSIAQKLQEAFGARGGKSSKIKITGDDASMQLLVTAPAETFNDIQEMVSKIDVSPTAMDIKLYPLKHARAADVLQKMTDLVRQILTLGRDKGVDLGVFSAVADERSNTLVVAGSSTTFPVVEKVLLEIDRAPPESAEIKTMVYPLIKTQAQEVADTISRLFGQKRSDGLEPPRAQANPSTNTVVVMGTQAQLDEINEQVIKKLEEYADEAALVREIVPLQNARAADLATVITQSISQSPRGGRSALQLSVVPNEALNQLVVVGPQKDIDAVKPMIQTLDQKDTTQRTTRTFKLNHADAGALRDAVTQLFRPAGGRPTPRDQVDAYPDWGSNSLMVSASPENMAKIEDLIKQFDQQGAGERGVHVIEIKNADAAAVARSLNDIFVNRARNTRGQETISISNPQGTSSLMVRANEKELADIQAVIADLETGPGGQPGEIKVIPLKFTDATETQTILQEYLRKPGQSGGRAQGGDLAGNVRISVSSDTNSLIVSGDAEQLQQVSEVIAKIDVEIPDAGNAPKIIKLEHQLASAIQPSIEQLFSQQRQGGRQGRPSNIPPVIVADDGSNSLIVRASVVDFNNIQGLVETLDTPEATLGAGVEIVQVAAGVNVSDMAAMVEESLNSNIETQQSRRQGGGPRERLMVSADTRTNSLILAGAPSVYGQAKEMIRALEKLIPKGDRKTIILRPKNMNVDDIKAVMEQMIQDNGGTGSQRSTSPRRNTGSGSRGNRPRN